MSLLPVTVVSRAGPTITRELESAHMVAKLVGGRLVRDRSPIYEFDAPSAVDLLRLKDDEKFTSSISKVHPCLFAFHNELFSGISPAEFDIRLMHLLADALIMEAKDRKIFVVDEPVGVQLLPIRKITYIAGCRIEEPGWWVTQEIRCAMV